MGLNKVGSASRKSRKFILRKRTIGIKRPLNRFEAETDLSGVSAPAQKMKNAARPEVTVDPTFSYCFTAFVSVVSTISEHVLCRECHSKVEFHQSSERGLGFKRCVY